MSKIGAILLDSDDQRRYLDHFGDLVKEGIIGKDDAGREVGMLLFNIQQYFRSVPVIDPVTRDADGFIEEYVGSVMSIRTTTLNPIFRFLWVSDDDDWTTFTFSNIHFIHEHLRSLGLGGNFIFRSYTRNSQGGRAYYEYTGSGLLQLGIV